MTLFVRICRVALAALFIAAAIPKLLDPASFARAVAGYGVLPYGAISPMAMWIPWLELAVAAALLSRGEWVSAGAWTACGLLGIFAAAIAFNLALGREVACGCFSQGADGPVGWGHVAADLVGCVVALLAGSNTGRHSTGSRAKESV